MLVALEALAVLGVVGLFGVHAHDSDGPRLATGGNGGGDLVPDIAHAEVEIRLVAAVMTVGHRLAQVHDVHGCFLVRHGEELWLQTELSKMKRVQWSAKGAQAREDGLIIAYPQGPGSIAETNDRARV